jgi:hypothetical protein
MLLLRGQMGEGSSTIKGEAIRCSPPVPVPRPAAAIAASCLLGSLDRHLPLIGADGPPPDDRGKAMVAADHME